MDDPKGEYLKVDGAKARALVSFLTMVTAGPAEAYATMLLALKILFDMNAEETGETHTDDEIIAEFAASWRSIKEIRNATHN